MPIDFSDIGGQRVEETPSPAQTKPSLDFSDLGGQPVSEDKGPSPALTKLMQQGYFADDYLKLNPEEKAFYDAQLKEEGHKTAAGLGEGLSKGAFFPVELASKLMPGEATPNLRQRLISSTERGIANLIGDKQTQDYYNQIPQEELVKQNVEHSNQIQQEAPGATKLGEAVGSLPSMIAAGGGANAAAKAAQLGKLGVAATNVAAGGALGEGQGIAHSEADTLAGRAKEAVPSAILGMGTAGLVEGAGALISPEGQALTQRISDKVKELRNNRSFSSLNPTYSDVAKYGANRQAIGAAAFEQGTPYGPLTTEAARADALKSAKSLAGQDVEANVARISKGAEDIRNPSEGPGVPTQNLPADAQKKVSDLLNLSSLRNEIQEAPFYQKLQNTRDPGNTQWVIDEQLQKLNSLPDTSLKNINDYRIGLDDTINYNKNPLTGQDTPISAQLKNYRAKLDEALMSRAKQIDEIAGTNSYDSLVQAKKQYGATASASRLAIKSASKEEAKAATLPTTMYQGGKQAVKKYGNSLAASGLNQLSNLVKTTPQVLGKFAPALQSAANRGSTSLAATHFSLYQNDPAYRAVIDPLQEESEKQAKEQGQ